MLLVKTHIAAFLYREHHLAPYICEGNLAVKCMFFYFVCIINLFKLTTKYICRKITHVFISVSVILQQHQSYNGACAFITEKMLCWVVSKEYWLERSFIFFKIIYTQRMYSIVLSYVTFHIRLACCMYDSCVITLESETSSLRTIVTDVIFGFRLWPQCQPCNIQN